MFEIDKSAFGAFVSALRRERGMTQRELAGKLYISDKAVSKWETGSSLPDISLLTPLAEELGVTVTELLNCRRMEEGETLAPEETEELLRRALELTPQVTRRPKKSSVAVYLTSLAVSALEIAILIGRAGWRPGSEDVFFWLLEIFGALFGAYFFLFVKNRLPKFYDENRINYYTDGMIRIHMAGVSLNNKNWPRILTAFRAWSALALVIAPALCYALDRLTVPDSPWRIVVTLTVLLGGLFIPAYIAAAKK